MTSIARIRQTKNAFLKISDVSHLGKLLDVEPYQLSLLSIQPQYKVYKIPKKNNQWRLIEDPNSQLKTILRKLNDYLQASYYYVRPEVVHQ